MLTNDEKTMSSEGLFVHLAISPAQVVATFEGVSDSRDPAAFLGEVSSKLLEVGQSKRVLVDFRKLEYMNSATLSPILALMRSLAARKIPATLVYNSQTDWQRVNFKCMQVIAKTLTGIEVTDRAPSPAGAGELANRQAGV